MLPRHVAAATDESYMVIMQHVLSLHAAPILRGALKLYAVLWFFCWVEQLAALH